MSPSLRRLTAISTIVGAALLAVHGVTHELLYGPDPDLAQVAQEPTRIAISIVELGAAMLLALGLFGLYERQAARARTLGLASFFVFFVGLSMLIGVAFGQAFLIPAVAQHAPNLLRMNPLPPSVGWGFLLGLVSLAGGFVLFGIATIRARVFPRPAGYGVAIGGPLGLAPGSGIFAYVSLAALIVLCASLAWMGFLLATTPHGAETARTALPAHHASGSDRFVHDRAS